MVTIRDIEQAQNNITPYATLTPLVRSSFLCQLCNAEVFLKMESEQVTHAFKVRRGDEQAAEPLTEKKKLKGVITASAGNHGQAVALALKSLVSQRKLWCQPARRSLRLKA